MTKLTHTVRITDLTYKPIKMYCMGKNLIMGKYISDILLEYIIKNNIGVENDEISETKMATTT